MVHDYLWIFDISRVNLFFARYNAGVGWGEGVGGSGLCISPSISTALHHVLQHCI